MILELDPARTPFSLSHTLSCGQTFRWEKKGDWWIGVVRKTVLKIRQKETRLEFEASSSNVSSDFIWDYFRLHDDLLDVYSNLTKDRYTREAVARFRGLRLVRQEPWECLASYICATFKNIPAIKQMVSSLCIRFGELIEFKGDEFRAFPEPKALEKASVKELRRCRLGFRAERLLETSRIVSKGDFDLDILRTLPYESAKEKLLTLPGVGPKVADCVLLFSLDKLEAFPIDVWMKRIIVEHYPQHFDQKVLTKLRASKGFSSRDYQIVHNFGQEYFGKYLGYAQEYLYHHKRCQR